MQSAIKLKALKSATNASRRDSLDYLSKKSPDASPKVSLMKSFGLKNKLKI